MIPMNKRSGIVLGGAAALLCLAVGTGTAQTATLARTGFDLQGHRGARGLAPENTLAAFRRALAIGVTTLETDIAVTRDGIAVLSHNPKLNPDLVRDGGSWLDRPGPSIHSLSLAELRRYDIGRVNPASRYAQDFPEQNAADGERFPALAELLDLVKASGKPVRLDLETKLTPDNAGDTVDPATFVRVIVDTLKEAAMLDRATLQSFDWRTLLEAKRLAPQLPTSCLTIESANDNTMTPGADGASPWHAGLRIADQRGSVPALVKAAGCGTWSMFWRNLTPALADEAHALGLKVVPWTVNDPAQMRRLIDIGVDGIITDYPDRLRRVMAERSLALP
jgi:glycerophosphoryl diester phosphodiesterase